MKTIIAMMVLVSVTFFTGAGFPQDYPSKTVKVMVPFTTGSATDVFARAVSQKLSEFWKQTVDVENHPGAGGTVGADLVAKSKPDGYTLLFHASAHAVNAVFYSKLPYDTLKDFVEIAPIATQPFVLVVGPSAGIKSVSELIAAAKAKPGQITFASAGIGSGAHFAAEKFKAAARIDAGHVPYKGGPEANADTIAGRVTFWFPPIAMALPAVREKKLLALCVTSAKRSNVLPEVPTTAEAGVAGFEDANWWGLWAPAGIPASVTDKLANDITRALAASDLRERFTKLGAEPMNMTPAEFARFVRSEIESTAKVVKEAGIKPQ